MVTIYNTCTDSFYSIYHYAQTIHQMLQDDGIPTTISNQGVYEYMGIPIQNFHGSTIIVEHNNKFIIFYYGDGNTIMTPTEIPDFHMLKALPNCVGTVSITRPKAENLYQSELPYIEHKYCAVNEMYTNHYQDQFDTLRNAIFFSGTTFQNRLEFLGQLHDGGLAIHLSNSTMNMKEYFKALKQYKLVASPPGGCDINKRDIECFGLGIPIIRPRYTTIEHLQPQVHYISSEYALQHADTLFDDKELLCSVVRNAREYYEQYILKQDYLITLIKRFIQETQ